MANFKTFDLSALIDMLSHFTDYHKLLLSIHPKPEETEVCENTILSVQHEIERRQIQNVIANNNYEIIPPIVLADPLHITSKHKARSK